MNSILRRHFSSLNSSVAYITGAGGGLGRATALRFAKNGCRVCVVDLSESTVQSTANEINKLYGKCKNGKSLALPLVVDVSSEDQVKSSIQRGVEEFGGISILVNCAGIATPMRVISKKGPHSLQQFEKVIQVNTVGTFNCIRLIAESMSQHCTVDNDGLRGVIINTASIAAMDGQIGQAAYAASKGAIVSMTLPIARELSSLGIRVCTIAPGLFLTPLLEALPPQVQGALAETVPLPRRLGHPDEFAHLAQSIVENSMLNGEVIRLDGALRMQP
mmetsp:Transcript_9396/g.12852  ORF Transcript_9396/g.12852 Transcript_9396/m.12852 type:complete len:275 (+) Transcript_9396:2-826(+)